MRARVLTCAWEIFSPSCDKNKERKKISEFYSQEKCGVQSFNDHFKIENGTNVESHVGNEHFKLRSKNFV